jgi:hypothetical protein
MRAPLTSGNPICDVAHNRPQPDSRILRFVDGINEEPRVALGATPSLETFAFGRPQRTLIPRAGFEPATNRLTADGCAVGGSPDHGSALRSSARPRWLARSCHSGWSNGASGEVAATGRYVSVRNECRLLSSGRHEFRLLLPHMLPQWPSSILNSRKPLILWRARRDSNF